ncbi:DUF3667 domain-containing protein [Mucilaginibacter terrigena]|uniref:DUF3667 domain-containing protein n=1 Tax=Mucilaginibacter terrigena TaxID=2492395 RepID=A0A4Q5LLL5_9SPHI|nr:DUF3667 domain-containing protein [Mucilaginibacter terrigena]RYU90634.1 DUF3667 domain-containing protein [Mucilaginibacter terrigena]
MDITANLTTCKACGAEGSGNYCHACGELYHTHRITLKHMLHEVWHLFTHFDKGFGYTLKQLMLKPGYMQEEYIAGRRSLYQKPFSMFFLCGTITALALYWINRGVLAIHASGDEAEGHYYQHYFVLLQMCLVPAYSFVAYLVFSKRYNFAEYLVILLYNTSMLFMFICIANFFKLIFGAFETGYIEIVIVLLYNVLTYLNLFNDEGRASVILRTLLSSVICFCHIARSDGVVHQIFYATQLIQTFNTNFKLNFYV